MKTSEMMAEWEKDNSIMVRKDSASPFRDPCFFFRSYRPEELFLITTWEIKPKTVEISREDIAKAWDLSVAPESNAVDYANSDKSRRFNNFCKELGL